MNTIDIEDSLALSVCMKQPVAIARGLGARVWDEQGRAFLDFTAGWGVTSLGHSHPVLVAAIAEQAGRLMQNPNSGFTYSPVRAKLLQQLQAVLPAGLERVFFANSGAEANDAAVKLARKVTGRSKVLVASNSFHGRTLATLSLSGGPENGARFAPQVPGHQFLPFGDVDALRAAMDAEVAAVLLEPVQGEGGVRLPSPDYLPAVAELCRERGALLIADEVQTGFCRTGSFFAVDAVGVQPDILTMGKGIAGGFPLAAFAVTARVAAGVARGDHGGTYCGNPLGCAAASAVVDYLVTHDVAARVARLGQVLLQDLQQLAEEFPGLLREVRGKGLLLGLQLHSDAQVSALTEAALARGLLVTPTRNAVLRLIPSLLLEPAEWEEGLGILRSACADVLAQVPAAVRAA